MGVARCRLGYSVCYLRTSRFLHTLNRARQDGSYLDLLHSQTKTEVLILDDWIRDPIPIAAAQELLEVFDDRFGKAATIIASQVPVADAILDRTVHSAYRISLLGESQRKLRGFRAMSHT